MRETDREGELKGDPAELMSAEEAARTSIPAKIRISGESDIRWLAMEVGSDLHATRDPRVDDGSIPAEKAIPEAPETAGAILACPAGPDR